MSVEVLLIPAAMAAYSMWKAARVEDNSDRKVCVVQTRLRDDTLLEQALQDLGADVHSDGTAIQAHWVGVSARFQRSQEGVLSAHFEGEVDAARADEIALAIDEAYARRVQAAVYERIKARASEMNLTVESETVNDDHSITVVLQTGAAS